MKKSIVKTICISATLFVCFVAGLFGILSVAAPKTMAEYYNKIGLTGLSLSCNDIYYGNSDDITNQFAMFNQAVSAGNNALTKKYAKKLLEHENIDKFNEFLNEEHKQVAYLQNEKNRIVENYVKALYNTKQVNTAVEYAFNTLKASEPNAAFIVGVSGIGKNYKFSSQQQRDIEEKYTELYSYFDGAEGINKKVAAYRLSELLEVMFRFKNSEAYTAAFNSIKDALKN